MHRPVVRAVSNPAANVVAPSVAVLPHLLTIKEAATVLHVSVRTIHTLKTRRQLTFFKVRGQLRFDPAHLSEYLAKRMVKAVA